MADRKVGEITVPTEPVSRATKITGFTFKSYDKNAGVLQFNIENQDGSPTDLIDATVRLFMHIYKGEEKKEFPIFDNQIITESYMQGIVKYRIPDMLLSYEGKVDANVYIDFPDGSHTDNLAFTFNIEKSIIDGDVQLNGEYYFKDFQQLLDGVKQEATDAVNAALTNVDSTIEKANQQINEFVEGATQAIDQTVDEVTEQLQATQTKIDTVSQNVTSAQNNLKAVEDKMNQTNQQIGDLGKLKKMYSNSIDFGDYDYSGRANLAPNLDFSKFSGNGITMTKPLACFKDHETYLELDSSDPSAVNTSRTIYVPNCSALLPNNTYIMTVPIMINADFDDFRTAFVLKTRDGTALGTVNPPRENVGTWQNVTKVFTVPSNLKFDNTYLQLWQPIEGNGKLYVGYDIKIEKVNSPSDTATPYQPNLLDAPYYLSKVALGENIADPAVKFPISSSSEGIYSKNALEDFVLGETYTVTIGATKPASQTIRVYLAQKQFSDFKPVEGLVDTWVATVSITQLGENTKGVYLFQTPNTSLGSCTIKWLKIEKGDTRTPNISEYKYFGEGLKDSNNPNDYSWDITPEYAEKGLNNTVSLTEPQSVEGLKNFEDGLQIAGEEVATVAESTGWLALTLVDGFEVAENNPPQYKITYQANGDNEIEFRGEFQLTGGTKFTKDTSYYPFGRANQATNIPNELKPDRTAFGYGATSTGVGGRLAVTTTPNFVFIPGDSDGTYCSISPLRYTQTKK
ncbi:BppU family phage baseplate upper protein [Enterococcus sp. DIV1224]|uniref:BppU family phage baseplate upper protein n=1 Tax=Enterococcus sp. DIV1224 TaxID=2774845 RepID=UPI003D2FE27A